MHAGGAFNVLLTEDASGNEVTHAASQTLPMHAWTRVAIGITLPVGTNGATPATLSFNGTEVVNARVHRWVRDPIPEILVGVTFATPTAGGWAVRYDDVTFE